MRILVTAAALLLVLPHRRPDGDGDGNVSSDSSKKRSRQKERSERLAERWDGLG